MKIFHTADWHLGKKLDGFSRLDEQKLVLAEIVSLAQYHHPDLIIIAGDIYDTFSPTNEAQILLYETLIQLSQNGKIPIIVIAGNHDSPDKIDSPDALAQYNGIIFIGYPFAKIENRTKNPHFEICKTDYGFIELKLNHIPFPIRIIHTAYPNETRLKIDLNLEQAEDAFRSYLQQKWQNLADTYCDSKGVNILITHAFVMPKLGEIPVENDDEKPLSIGGADAIFTDHFPEQIQYVALGHIHRMQELKPHHYPIVYSGSILNYSFAEGTQQKYILMLNAQPDLPIEMVKLELNAGKKLVKAVFDNINEACEWLAKNTDNIVELTMQSKTYLSAENKKLLHECHPNIIRIIPVMIADKESEQSIKIKNVSEMSIQELFYDFFFQKHQIPPNEEIKQLFNDILSLENYDTTKA